MDSVVVTGGYDLDCLLVTFSVGKVCYFTTFIFTLNCFCFCFLRLFFVCLKTSPKLVLWKICQDRYTCHSWFTLKSAIGNYDTGSCVMLRGLRHYFPKVDVTFNFGLRFAKYRCCSLLSLLLRALWPILLIIIITITIIKKLDIKLRLKFEGKR